MMNPSADQSKRKTARMGGAPTMVHYSLMERMLSGEASLAEGATHPDWRVRYAAAVAMGETGSTEWLPALLALIRHEETLDLYSQPRVAGYENSYDDTRMAEQLQPIRVLWEQAPPAHLLEGWRCRGRVLQACLFAVEAIGQAEGEVLNTLHQLLTHGDSAVKAASARALIRVGTRESLPFLRAALEVDEWCLQTEAKKAIHRIESTP